MADEGLDDEQERRAEELTDELAKKYDPDRLLKVVSKRAGRGDPLEHSVRQKYETRFGVDLGHVRVYTGEFAQEFNKQRNAYAVTIGSTGMILMGGSAEKSMGSAAGQALLAHELTHVAQQAKGLHRKASFGGAMPFAEEHEAEADVVEHAVMQELMLGQQAPVAGNGDDASRIAEARTKMEAKLKQAVEQVKDRVMELMGDQARNHHTRGNGHARRA
ncbi:MAG TPA: DUF4157 domain-containing protein [Kofleriaceae bacterium]